MNLFFILTSFVAGVLTVLAPCVLPLLPIMVSGSVGAKNYKKPFVISASLALSVVAFTLLLKASTVFIDIPQDFWKYLSGGLLLIFGISMVFPNLWTSISLKLGFEEGSQKLINKAGGKNSSLGDVLLGASLGPVFSSCSPTYFVILATVLPASFLGGIFYLLVYAFGLFTVLFAIGVFGQTLTKKLRWAANPSGNFRRGIGVVVLLVGLAIVSGVDKDFETYLIDKGLGTTRLEEYLLESLEDDMDMETDDFMPSETSEFPEYYKAPELTGLQNWINSDTINSMEELEGKVVLVDFWTYSCINCIRTLPYIQSWHEKYADDGLVILGIHAPEFQFEQKLENVKQAVDEFGLTYPVVQDNDFATWRAYNNHYWPAKYLIDKNGYVRYEHFGEGEYEETEELIVKLLNTEMDMTEVEATEVDFSQIKTPETYVGLARRENYIENAEELELSQWTLIGDFAEDAEKATVNQIDSSIKMKFKAAKANLVLGGQGQAEIYIDGELVNTIEIDGNKLYEVANFDDEYGEHLIEIKFLDIGIELFAWTFG